MADSIYITIGEDGVAREYNDEWDITIHCENEEEYKQAMDTLTSLPFWRDPEKELPETAEEVLIVADVISAGTTCIKSRKYLASYYPNAGWTRSDYLNNSCFTVKAWTYIPKWRDK